MKEVDIAGDENLCVRGVRERNEVSRPRDRGRQPDKAIADP
jgi:hypothetical protein